MEVKGKDIQVKLLQIAKKENGKEILVPSRWITRRKQAIINWMSEGVYSKVYFKECTPYTEKLGKTDTGKNWGNADFNIEMAVANKILFFW